MAQEPLDPERILWDMKPEYEAAMDGIELNQRVCEAVTKELGRIAREHYPGMKDWQSEQLRALADRISRHASQFCIEVSDLDYAAEQAEAAARTAASVRP